MFYFSPHFEGYTLLVQPYQNDTHQDASNISSISTKYAKTYAATFWLRHFQTQMSTVLYIYLKLFLCGSLFRWNLILFACLEQGKEDYAGDG